MAEPITKFDLSLTRLASDMFETMRHAPGIGLAAPQIGESIRLIVIEIPADKEGGDIQGPFAVCNPMVTKKKGNAKIEEGCLSVPGFYLEVDRAKEITIEGQNPDGSKFSMEAGGLLAICFQHELDHLDGKLLINYVSSVKRALYKSEIKKRAKTEGKPEDRRPAL